MHFHRKSTVSWNNCASTLTVRVPGETRADEDIGPYGRSRHPPVGAVSDRPHAGLASATQLLRGRDKVRLFADLLNRNYSQVWAGSHRSEGALVRAVGDDMGSPRKPSVSGFRGERTSKGAKRAPSPRETGQAQRTL